MKSFLNKLHIFYLAVVGSLLIILQLYFRLFKSKSSYSLDSLRENLSPLGLFLSINFLLIHLVAIISIVYMLYKQYYSIQGISKIMQYTSKIVDILYWKPLEYIHDIIAPDLPYSGIFLLYVGKVIKRNKKRILILAVVLFDFLPKIMLTAIFSIELIFYERLYYFIHFISLILLPIIFSILIKLMESFALRNLPLMRKILVIESMPHKPGELFGYTFSLQKNYSYLTKEQLNFYAQSWGQLVDLDNYAFQLKKLKADYSSYIVLITSLCYLFASIYKFLYLFF
jgi:hypothetical protein